MSTWKRAFLYTVRKKVKTVILFFLLLAMSTFTLTGLSIYKAADNSASSLWQSIGGSIRLEFIQWLGRWQCFCKGFCVSIGLQLWGGKRLQQASIRNKFRVF